MKRSFRKQVSWAVAPVLSISLLAGCTGGAPAATGTGTSTNTAKENKPAAAEPVKIQFLVPSFAEVPNMADQYWTEFQKRSNSKLDIEWIPSGDYDTKFDLVLASGNLPEVIVSQSATRPTLLNAINQGAFWDLTPLLGDFSQYPNLKKNADPNVWNYMKVNGKIYGVARNRPNIDPGIKMRKDWLDKLNLPIPQTLDEYTAALKKIVESDLDGNGKKDTIGILGHGFLVADGDPSYLAAFGGLDPIFDKDGGLIKETLTPNYTQMIDWFRKQYADGIMAKEFSTIKKTQAEEMFATGRAASYTRNIWRDFSWEQDIKKVQPEANVITLPPMKGPGGVSVALVPPFFGAFYISKKVPEAKVKQILEYFNTTTTKEFTDFNYFGIEGVHHKLVDGQPQLTDQGVKEVTTNANQPFPMAFNNIMKVFNASAPKAYNDAKIKDTEVFAKVGKMNLFNVVYSDTWTTTWPKYEKEWQSMVIKAIVGQISMDEYKSYVDKLNTNADIKKSYQEFAAKYKEFFGK
ncbi:extracellular solute-binding protein [Paenibacillus sp. FSL H7-0331]|uniref:extracellular solute-binding protein n=1 Tax=Paenibacillus sp. FSL H7-0331 TaxID=1920421 RepID=UPI00096C3C5C|nr:extracellular solute-binding protein [Paenibacillus sp. FSL H7-0331]OMF18733.1 ABC transporter substrate-binding protein [Paenibacillus sp. FSL H7-0331]